VNRRVKRWGTEAIGVAVLTAIFLIALALAAFAQGHVQAKTGSQGQNEGRSGSGNGSGNVKLVAQVSPTPNDVIPTVTCFPIFSLAGTPVTLCGPSTSTAGKAFTTFPTVLEFAYPNSASQTVTLFDPGATSYTVSQFPLTLFSFNVPAGPNGTLTVTPYGGGQGLTTIALTDNLGNLAEIDASVLAGLPTPVPTVTPEPLAPMTTQMLQQDSVADSLGIDTNISQASSPTTDYGFTVEALYMCGPWYGVQTCWRHYRDFSVVPNAAHPNYQADNNLLGQYGMFVASQANSTNQTAALTADLANFNNLELVVPINEPDAAVYGMFVHTAYTPGPTNITVNSIGTSSLAGDKITIGEGTNQESNQITSYPSTSTMSINLATALVNAHAKSINTTLATPIPGGTPYPAVFPTAYSTTPIILSSYPPVPTPSPSATSLVVTSATGFAVGDYITVNCPAVNIVQNLTTEVEQITGISGTTLTVTPGFSYAHIKGEPVNEGCIRRVNDNMLGELQGTVTEQLRIRSAIAATTGVLLANPAMAAPIDGFAFWPNVGGTPFNLGSYDIDQEHDYPISNVGGQYGDGTTGDGNVHPDCFGQNATYGSWQWDYCGALAKEGLSNKPIYSTEFGWGIVPHGAVFNNGNSTNAQIPEDIGVAYSISGPLYKLKHGYSRVYNFQLMNGSGTSGFCTNALVYVSDACSPYYPVGLSGQQPKASFYALTDLISFFGDVCRVPGCSFVPDRLTWNWSALPPTAHSANPPTDPNQIQSLQYESSTGTVSIVYWYEATHYNFNNPDPGCGATTNCYQICGATGNTVFSGQVCFTDTLYIQGAHAWSGCINYDFDTLYTNANFGHLLAGYPQTFNSTDQISLSIKAEPQILRCTNTGFSPHPTGTPLPSPTPVAAITATPDPLPSWPTATPVPTPLQSPSPSPSPTPTFYPETLCVGGTDNYQLVQDDEFPNDLSLNVTSVADTATTQVATPTPSLTFQPNPPLWHSQFYYGRQNNVGGDDAYYTDLSQGAYFGNFNPFSGLNGYPLTITDEPVPAAYATASPLMVGATTSPTTSPWPSPTPVDHWLSGVLEAPVIQAQNGTYVEVAAEIPNVQGQWPAPIWLLAASGSSPSNTYPNPREIDGAELFGNALPESTIQQTIIYVYQLTNTPPPTSPPPSLNTRTIVAPAPDVAYHTYGIAWTPTTVTLYIDRVPQSRPYPVSSNVPMVPLLINQVFTNHTFAPPPANGNIGQSNFLWYRVYQKSGASTVCSEQPQLVVATPTPTPNPSPSAAAANITIVHSYHINAAISPQPIATTLAATPGSGHAMLLMGSIYNPLTSLPTGWTTLVSSPPGLYVGYGIVGVGGFAPTTAFNLGGNGGDVVLYELSGENQTLAPNFSAAPVGYNNQTMNESLLIQNQGGLTFDVYSIAQTNTSTTSNPLTAITDTLITGQATTSLLADLNQGQPGFTGTLNTAINKFTTEVYQAPGNTLTTSGAGNPSPAPTSPAQQFNQGAIVSWLPAGTTPGPTSTPYPPPSYPPQPTPYPSPGIYLGIRINETGGSPATYSQAIALPAFEAAMGRTMAAVSHFHQFTDVFPFSAKPGTPPVAGSVPYSTAETDEYDDIAHGRIPFTTWNCGDTTAHIAAGLDDNNLLDKAYRLKAFHSSIFVRYDWEFNQLSSSNGKHICFDPTPVSLGGSGDEPSPAQTPAGAGTPQPTCYVNSTQYISGVLQPSPGVGCDGYFNPVTWVQAWSHVYNLVKPIAPNMIMLWVPSADTIGVAGAYTLANYYPTDAETDWVGIDDYEHRGGTAASFADTGVCPSPNSGPSNATFDCPHQMYGTIAGLTSKPIFATETGVQRSGTVQPTWLGEWSATLQSHFPQIKGIAYFDAAGAFNWVLSGSAAYPTPTPNGYSAYKAMGATAYMAAPGLSPSPSPIPTATTVAIWTAGPIATPTSGALTVTLTNTPPPNSKLIFYASTTSTLTLPTGWTSLFTTPSGGSLQAAYCNVPSQCAAATSYNFGGTLGGIGQVVVLSGAASPAPVVPSPISTAIPFNSNLPPEVVTLENIPSAGGMTITLFSAYTGNSFPLVTQFAQWYPNTYTYTPLALATTVPAGAGSNSSFNLLANLVNQEAYPVFVSGGRPFALNTVTADASIVWVAPFVPTPPPPSPTPPSQGSITITQEQYYSTNVVDLTSVTGGVGALGYCWAVWGQTGGQFNLSGFDTKTTCGSILGNVVPLSSAFVQGGNAPPPTITWDAGDGNAPDTQNTAPPNLFTQIVAQGTSNGFILPVNDGTSSATSYKTINMIVGAYCTNMVLTVMSNDPSPVPMATATYTDTGIGTRELFHIVYSTTLSTSSLNITAQSVSQYSTNCGPPGLGIAYAYVVPTPTAIPTAPPSLAPPIPLAVSTTSVTFANPAATPTTIAWVDPGNTHAVTVSPAPVAIISASISSTGNYPATISQTHVYSAVQNLCGYVAPAASCYHGITTSVPISTVGPWISQAEVDSTSDVSTVSPYVPFVLTYADPNADNNYGYSYNNLFPALTLHSCSGTILSAGSGGEILLDPSNASFRTNFESSGLNQNGKNAAGPYNIDEFDNWGNYTEAYPSAPCPTASALTNGESSIIAAMTNGSGNIPVEVNGWLWDTAGPNGVDSSGYALAQIMPANTNVLEEGCYSTDAPWLNIARRIQGSDWLQCANTMLYLHAAHHLHVVLPENTTTDSSTIGDRMYAYASLLMDFNPQYSGYQGFWCLSSTPCPISTGPPGSGNSTAGGTNVIYMPEEGFVALNPVIPTGNTLNMSVFESNSYPGLFYREYNSCYYEGALVGACATVVNTSSSTATLPSFTNTYNATAVLTGYDLFDGGAMTFAGAAPASTIAGTTAEILIGTSSGSSTTAGTITLTPEASGNTNIYITDGTYTIPITGVVSNQTPAPTATFALPYDALTAGGAPSPVATALASPYSAQMSFVVSVKCSATTNGSSAMAIGGTAELDLGQCNGASPNPINGMGLHFWNAGTNAQAISLTSLTSNSTYLVAGTQSGSTITLFVCLYGGNSCATTSQNSTGLVFGTSPILYVGAGGIQSGGYTRLCNCDLWDAMTFTQPIGIPQVMAIFDAMRADPYTVPTPPPSAELSELFTGKTPFHNKVQTLLTATYPAQVLSSTIATNVFNQGIQSQWVQNGTPMYVPVAGSPQYTTACPNATGGSAGVCNWAGYQVYFTAGATTECNPYNLHNCTYDFHIASVDPLLLQVETDIWESNQSPCTNVACSSGSFSIARFPFTGSGLTQDSGFPYDSSNAGGYADALFELNPQDITSGNITHALGLIIGCSATGSPLYPSITAPGRSLNVCGVSNTWGANQATNTLQYGELIQYTGNTAPAGSSKECQTILTAMNVYGMYLMDTNNYGWNIPTTNYNQYTTSPNPWDQVIADMSAAGEGSGSGENFLSNWCLKYITSASQIRVIEVNQGGTADLPPPNT